ncbi:hypothetical protein EDM52_08735 [Brevibacillus invocatus]|uniref:DUF3888 domain-containing protein n=1 Tax=Brevibacillus invocatus TaxID=173959 RepID=A0A3M8CH04_9BACL|nr:hypothetical protein [Brevibacillus invocatus]RNB74803.1 hypothetical protein EDM52_08735 [Brevibacillus invocatus]
MKKVVIALLALFLLVMPVSSAAPPESREQLLEGALINRYLDLVGSTLQKPFGCEKISEIKRVGDPRIPAFEFKLEVVTYGGRYGEPPIPETLLVVQTLRVILFLFSAQGNGS